MSVKSDSLLLITDSFNASVIKFFQSNWDLNFDRWHRWHLWLVHSSKSRAKKRALNLSSILITDIVESVVFQEVSVENDVAVLLVNVSAMEQPVVSFDALSEHFFAVFVKDGFPLG